MRRSTRRFALAALPVLLLAGASATLPAPAVAAPGASATAQAPAGGPVWGTNLEEALRLAKASGKPILIDLYAEWCTWCKVLEKEVFPTALFRAFVADKILLRVDTEDDGDGAMLYARYGTQSLPTLVIVDAHLALMASVEGYAPAEQWVAQARAGLERHRAYAQRVKAALAATPGTMTGDGTTPPAVALERERRGLIDEARRRADGPRAAVLLEKLLAQAENPFRRIDLMNLAEAYRLTRRWDDAERTARTLRDEAAAASDQLTAERAELLAAAIRSERGLCGDAKLALQSFLREHPQSRFSGYAQQMLDSLPAQAQVPGGRCA